MGRIYDTVAVNGKQLVTLFDSGAVHSYITKKATQQAKLRPQSLKNTYKAGLGGKEIAVKKYCNVEGKLQGGSFYLMANVTEELGKGEKYEKEIDFLFGAHDMQVWNIKLDLKEEKLDLSDFRKVFIEF